MEITIYGDEKRFARNVKIETNNFIKICEIFEIDGFTHSINIFGYSHIADAYYSLKLGKIFYVFTNEYLKPITFHGGTRRDNRYTTTTIFSHNDLERFLIGNIDFNQLREKTNNDKMLENWIGIRLELTFNRYVKR